MSILTPIVNEITPSGNGVNSSRDCNRVYGVLVVIANRLYLDRYVSRTRYRVCVYHRITYFYSKNTGKLQDCH